MSGFGTQYIGFSQVTADFGSSWTVDVSIATLSGVLFTGYGTDRLVLTDSGKVDISRVKGFSTIELSSAGPNTLTLVQANFLFGDSRITVDGGAAADIITIPQLSGLQAVMINGGGGDDVVRLSEVAQAAVLGGSGRDELVVDEAGALAAGKVNGVEIYDLVPGARATVSLSLTNANFVGVTGGAITVAIGANAAATVNAAALGRANRVILFGGAGKDVLTGGAGNDIFKFTAAALTNTDSVNGGNGADELLMTSAGPVRAAKVSGVETYVLASGGSNSLSLAAANFAGLAGPLTVDGGSKGNKINAAGVAAADKAVLKGGASADTLIAARNAMLTGAGGKDVFEFTTPGSAKTPDNDTVADFAHGVDKIALSEKGFALGAKPVAATLFAAGPKGSFTSLSQRFAYDTATGQLFYDAHGSAAPSSRLAIAVLAHHPTLAASDLRFVA